MSNTERLMKFTKAKLVELVERAEADTKAANDRAAASQRQAQELLDARAALTADLRDLVAKQIEPLMTELQNLDRALWVEHHYGDLDSKAYELVADLMRHVDSEMDLVEDIDIDKLAKDTGVDAEKYDSAGSEPARA